MPATRKASGYVGEAIVDPEHKLASYLRERGLVDVQVTEKKGYDFGVAQPAIVVQKQVGEVLFEWHIVPSAVSCCPVPCMVLLDLGLIFLRADESGGRKGSA